MKHIDSSTQKKLNHRSILIFKRWCDIVLLTLLISLFSIYIEPVIKIIARSFQEIGSGWNDYFVLLVYLIIPLIIGYILKVIGGFRFKDFDVIYSFTNPPAWYAAILGVTFYPILSFFLNKSPILDHPLFYWSIILFFAPFIVCTISNLVGRISILLFHKFIRQDRPTDQINQRRREKFNKDIGKIIEWLKKEKPVEKDEDDFFNSEIIAHRISEALPIKSISLIGPYGSGKTTILILQRHMIMVYPESNSVASRAGYLKLVTSAAFAEHNALWPAGCVFVGIESIRKLDNKLVFEPTAESFEPLPIPMPHNEPARMSDTNCPEFFSLRS